MRNGVKRTHFRDALLELLLHPSTSPSLIRMHLLSCFEREHEVNETAKIGHRVSLSPKMITLLLHLASSDCSLPDSAQNGLLWLLSQCNAQVDAQLGDLAAIIYEQYDLPGDMPEPLRNAVHGSRGDEVQRLWTLATRPAVKELLLQRWIERASWTAASFQSKLQPLLEDPAVIEVETLRRAYNTKMAALLSEPSTLADVLSDSTLDFFEATSTGFLVLLERLAPTPSYNLYRSEYSTLARKMLQHRAHGAAFAKALLDICVRPSRPRAWLTWALSLVASSLQLSRDSPILLTKIQLCGWMSASASYRHFLEHLAEVTKLLSDLNQDAASDTAAPVPTVADMVTTLAASPTLNNLARQHADVLKCSALPLFAERLPHLQRLHLELVEKALRVQRHTEGWTTLLQAATGAGAVGHLDIANPVAASACHCVLQMWHDELAQAAPPGDDPGWMQSVTDAEFWCLISTASGHAADAFLNAELVGRGRRDAQALARELQDRAITHAHALRLTGLLVNAPMRRHLPRLLALAVPQLDQQQWLAMLDSLVQDVEAFRREREEMHQFWGAVNALAGQWLSSPTPAELVGRMDARHAALAQAPWAVWGDDAQRWDEVEAQCAAWPHRQAFVQLAEAQAVVNALLEKGAILRLRHQPKLQLPYIDEKVLNVRHGLLPVLLPFLGQIDLLQVHDRLRVVLALLEDDRELPVGRQQVVVVEGKLGLFARFVVGGACSQWQDRGASEVEP